MHFDRVVQLVLLAFAVNGEDARLVRTRRRAMVIDPALFDRYNSGSLSLSPTPWPNAASVTSEPTAAEPVIALTTSPTEARPTYYPTATEPVVSLSRAAPSSAPTSVHSSIMKPTLMPQTSYTNSFPCLSTGLIACVTDTGQKCNQVQPAEGNCDTQAPIYSLEFSYSPGTCGQSSNGQGNSFVCKDFDTFTSNETVSLACAGPDGMKLNVEPALLGPGGSFTVTSSSGSALPSYTNCSISSLSSSQVSQEVTFDTSGKVPLSLGDRFGALAAVSCGNLTCFQNMHFWYYISNVGSSSANVTRVDQYLNSKPTSMMDLLLDKELAPGASTSVENTVSLDTCAASNYIFELIAQAKSQEGSCLGDDFYIVTISPPTLSPVVPPTSAPTFGSSSASPTSTPLVMIPPSNAPVSAKPTSRPSTAPTLTPTYVRGLDVNVTFQGSQLNFSTTATSCTARPLELTFLYTGGTCDQSYNVQDSSTFSCTDLGTGPPATIGAQSFIIVSARNDSSAIYYEGLVAVGEQFNVTDGGKILATEQTILIYDAPGGNLLQNVSFSSSCSNNLFLNDQFGAVQLVGWYSKGQGRVSSFEDVEFHITVRMPRAGGNITLRSFVVNTTFFGTVNLTNSVNGQVVSPGSAVELNFTISIDVTVRRRYTIDVTLSGVTKSGEKVHGVGVVEVVVGNPLPHVFPSMAPSKMPVLTPEPTPDPRTTVCELSANITCIVQRNDTTQREQNLECNALAPPTATSCSGAGPTELRFLYTLSGCNQSTTTQPILCKDFNGFPGVQASPVFIQVTGNDTSVIFGQVLFPGQIFSVVSSTTVFGKLTILISTVANGTTAGKPLQSIELDASCGPQSDVRLLAHYGALQLIAYKNAIQGYQSAVEVIEQSFLIQNAGPLPAMVRWANVTSNIFGDFSPVSPPGGELLPGAEMVFPFNSDLVYLLDNVTITSNLTVAGYGVKSGLACRATASSTFTIGQG